MKGFRGKKWKEGNRYRWKEKKMMEGWVGKGREGWDEGMEKENVEGRKEGRR